MIGLSVAVISPGAGSFVLAAIAKLQFLGSGIQAEGWAVRLSSKNKCIASNDFPKGLMCGHLIRMSEYCSWKVSLLRNSYSTLYVRY